ncbi:MAG: hypothetical protein JWO57_976, partial [Pseudonocardiales bacterium]|nr:hypothetical protein [Pseudonocardiales bacterium]
AQLRRRRPRREAIASAETATPVMESTPD